MAEEPRVLLCQGAEARLFETLLLGRKVIAKERFSKKYRHPALDNLLTKERTKTEAKYLIKCRKVGIYTPTVYYVDVEQNVIYMEFIRHGITVREFLETLHSDDKRVHELATSIGRILGKLHANHIIHGDLTTSNIMFRRDGSPRELRDIVLIDFGLSHTMPTPEDKGVDLYVLEKAVLSTHPKSEHFLKLIFDSYRQENKHAAVEVLKKLEEVRLRGRKRNMIG